MQITDPRTDDGMFRNYVNVRDIDIIKHALRRGDPRRVFRHLVRSRRDRVVDAWQNPTPAQTEWWAIPEVQEHWNRLVTGDPTIDYFQYVAREYLAERHAIRALSLGCGSGHRELRWLDLADFSCIDSYDISPERIEYARATIAEHGMSDRVRFIEADVYDINIDPGSYDLVLGEQSIHHFTPLDELYGRIASWLAPDGYFILNEFVGPTRWQWTDRQLEAINALLTLMPAEYRRYMDGTTRDRIERPSILSMIRSDPSEAVESGNIMPLLPRYFEVMDVRPWAGAILHLLLSGISQNLVGDSDDARRWVRLAIEVEELLTSRGEVANDFVLAIARKRSSPLMTSPEQI